MLTQDLRPQEHLSEEPHSGFMFPAQRVWMPLLLQLLSEPPMLSQASGAIDPGSLRTDRQGNKMPTSGCLATLPIWLGAISSTSTTGNRSLAQATGSFGTVCQERDLIPASKCLTVPQRAHTSRPVPFSALFILFGCLQKAGEPPGFLGVNMALGGEDLKTQGIQILGFPDESTTKVAQGRF